MNASARPCTANPVFIDGRPVRGLDHLEQSAPKSRSRASSARSASNQSKTRRARSGFEPKRTPSQWRRNLCMAAR